MSRPGDGHGPAALGGPARHLGGDRRLGGGVLPGCSWRVTLGILGRSIDWGSPPWWSVAVGAVGVAAFTSAGFALGAYFPGRFIAPVAAFGALFAMGTSSQIGFSATSGWALILPTMSNSNFGKDAGIFYQFLPDLPIARVMFGAGVAVAAVGLLGLPVRAGGPRLRRSAAVVTVTGAAAAVAAIVLAFDRHGGTLRHGHPGAARRGQRPADPLHPGLRPGRNPGLCAAGLPVLSAGRDDRAAPGGSLSSPACPVPRSGPARSRRCSTTGHATFPADSRGTGSRDHRRHPAGIPTCPSTLSRCRVRSGWTTDRIHQPDTAAVRARVRRRWRRPREPGPAGRPGGPAGRRAGYRWPRSPESSASPRGRCQATGRTRRAAYPPQISAAAQRFAALPAAARHAWLAAHLAALRAGQLPLAQLP